MRRTSGSITSRRRGPAVVTVLALVLAGGLAGCSDDDGPESVLDSFLAGWRDGDLAEVAFISATGERVPAADVSTGLTELSGDLAKTPPALERAGDPRE